MQGVTRSVRQKAATGAAFAVLLAGGAFAAVSATGQSSGHGDRSARAHRLAAKQGGPVPAAARYLGIPVTRLSSELSSGKTLAQVADATPRKSAEGLLEALVVARRTNIAKASSSVTRRVTAEINRAGGPGFRVGATQLRGVAAGYLGTTTVTLQSELQSGKTLGQLAQATPGKSKAALIQTLVAARKATLASLLASGKLTQAREQQLLAHLQKRMTRMADRTLAPGA
jgi:hypothetical protein